MKKLTLNQSVIKEFCLYTGLSEAEAAGWTTLLQSAVSEIDGRIADRRSIERNQALLGHVAAALAFYRYRLLSGSGETVLKAGDLSVSSRGGITAARAVRDEALLAAGSLLKDTGFYFKATTQKECRKARPKSCQEE